MPLFGTRKEAISCLKAAHFHKSLGVAKGHIANAKSIANLGTLLELGSDRKFNSFVCIKF